MRWKHISYGKCPCSNFDYEQKIVEVRITVGNEKVILPEVPQGACLICGSRVYKAEVLEWVESLWHTRVPPHCEG